MEPRPLRVGQVSPDDLSAWDGSSWRPIRSHRWEPTARTHRMQLVVGGYLLLAGLFELVLATLSRDYVRQSTLAAVGRQSRGLTADQLRLVVETSVAIGVGAAAVIAVVYVVLGLLSIARRPPWLFTADLVVLGLVSLGVPVTIFGLLRGTAGPPAFLVPNLLLSLAALGLFTWMLSIRIRVGPWACVKTAA